MTAQHQHHEIAAHAVTRRLMETIAYPEHDPRSESEEYRQVHHHLKLRLVVKGQKLDGDLLGIEGHKRAERHQAHHQQEGPGPGL